MAKYLRTESADRCEYTTESVHSTYTRIKGHVHEGRLRDINSTRFKN